MNFITKRNTGIVATLSLSTIGWLILKTIKAHKTAITKCKLEYSVDEGIADCIKRVSLHYSLDDWKTVLDVPMYFHKIINKDNSEIIWYEKSIDVNSEVGKFEYCYRIEKYDGTVLWDNKNGENYVMQLEYV